MRELLICLATQPIKTTNTQALIDLHFTSAVWKQNAKTFLPDRVVDTKWFNYEDSKLRFQDKEAFNKEEDPPVYEEE